MVIPSYLQNVGVEVVDNRTSYFGLETVLTREILRAFQLDGRLPLEDPERADLRVRVILRNYVEEPQLFDPKTNQVLQYRLSVVYDLTSLDAREGKTLLEDLEKVRSLFHYTPEYKDAIPETREQAFARLAEEIGRSVVRRVLEGH
jgi:hypothetical protein